MDLAFSSPISGTYEVGDACHQQSQGAVAVWVVTDMHGNILLNNQALSSEGPRWVVAKGRITITRFWSASTAMIVCNVNSLGRPGDPTYSPFPELPRGVLRNLKGLTYGTTNWPLDKNDEICIWCGYIDSFRPVEQDDLKQGRLVRTFVGVIDTIVGSGSANQGTTVIIQCRDRMKYLMDSLSTYNSTDFAPIGLGQDQKVAGQSDLDTKTGDSSEISRVEVILEIARRSVGHLENAYSISNQVGGSLGSCSSVCGLKISQGYTKDMIVAESSPDEIFRVYEGPQLGRSYFGLPMSDSAAPPPRTNYVQTQTVEGLDDAGLSEDEVKTKYQKIAEELQLDIGSPGTPAEAKAVFLEKFKEKYGYDYPESGIPRGAEPLQEKAKRVLSQVDSNLTAVQVYDKYASQLYSAQTWARFSNLKPEEKERESSKVRQQFLDDYRKRRGREYALDDPEAGAIIQQEIIAQSGAGAGNEDKNIETGDSSPFIGGYTRTPKGLTDIDLALRARHPAMNIVTGRKPYATNVTGKNFAGMSSQVTDRVPLEYIKFLAMQEPWPTEFFCDHRSGEYWYAPRGLDITGFEDPKRFKRTYFYRHAAEEALTYLNQQYAHPAQALLLFREESSIINWRSNIIVTNTPSTNSSESMAVHLRLVPPFLEGRAYPCTYYTVVDETIGPNTTELVATAMAFARLYGKELKAASMHVLGDPSLCPGEAIQVLGSPLYGGGYSPAYQDPEQSQWLWDRNAVVDYYGDFKAIHQQLLDKLKSIRQNGTDAESMDSQTPSEDDLRNEAATDAGQNPAAGSATVADPRGGTKLSGKTSISDLDIGRSKVNSVNVTTLTQAEMMCPATFVGDTETNRDAPVTFREDPRTIWRCEAVIHKFNDSPGDGYKTEVALLSPW